MKKFCTNILFLFIVLTLLFSCHKDEIAAEASVTIKVVSSTSNSVSFNLLSENAVKLFYVVTEEGMQDGVFTELESSGDGTDEITVSGLKVNTSYKIKAYAVNSDGNKSELSEASAMTIEAPYVSIDVLSVTSSSVKFLLSSVNALVCKYAVADRSEAEKVELSGVTESGAEVEVSVDGLSENTPYSIVAVAFNEAEESQRVYKLFKTETEPVVVIDKFDTQSRQAEVFLNFHNVAKCGYALVKKGMPEPGESDYSFIDVKGDKGSIVLPSLEPETAYSIYVYGINVNGYLGKIVNGDFTTLEYVSSPFEITADNISSTDADINVTFDKEKYASFYFIMAESSLIGDVKKWSWKEKIESGWTSPMYQQYDTDMSCKLRTWNTEYSLFVEGTYMAGGIPVRHDGTLDESAAVWLAVKLKPVIFGESQVSCKMEDVATGCDMFRYRVETDNSDAECFYTGYVDGRLSEAEIEDYTKNNVITMLPCVNFNVDTVQSYLSPAAEYTFMAVAKDKNGKLGDVVYKIVNTKPLDYEGAASMKVSLSSVSKSEIVFDCILEGDAESYGYIYI